MNKFFALLFTVIILLGFNSGNNQVEENPLALDFPAYSKPFGSVVYVGCEDIQMPKSINFEIYGDSVIDLNAFDARLSIKLKFNWLYEGEWPNKLGVASIDIIKGDSVINNMDLSYLELEAFMNKYPESKRFKQIVRDDIYLVDENYDAAFRETRNHHHYA